MLNYLNFFGMQVQEVRLFTMLHVAEMHSVAKYVSLVTVIILLSIMAGQF